MTKDKKEFKRQNSHKNKRIPNKWKKPEGKHSDIRLNKKHAPAQPKAGYRTPKETRDLHPSGYQKTIVNRPKDLQELDPETEAAIIDSQVGQRKRNQIIQEAENQDIKILNKKPEEHQQGDKE